MREGSIAINLRRIRTAKRMTQAQVSDAAAISRIAYRNIETGESIPKVSTLQDISRALGVQLQDLVAPARTLRCVRFRSLKKLAAREQILTEVARWLHDFNVLEDLLSYKDEYRLNHLAHVLSTEDSLARHRAVDAAVRARDQMDIRPSESIRDICGLLEAQGIKVFPMKFASEGFFGLSVGGEEDGPAVIVNVWDRIAVERWIFSAVHELGHLLLHLDAYDVAQSDENEQQEDEANVFASHFLMPADVFEKEWRETNGLHFVYRVLKVKRIFRVSYLTVLYRLFSEYSQVSVWQRFHFEFQRAFGRSLGKKDEPQGLGQESFSSKYVETRRSQEPDNLTNSDFVEDRLSSLVRRAIESEKISVSRGAEILGLSLSDMRETMASWAVSW